MAYMVNGKIMPEQGVIPPNPDTYRRTYPTGLKPMPSNYRHTSFGFGNNPIGDAYNEFISSMLNNGDLPDWMKWWLYEVWGTGIPQTQSNIQPTPQPTQHQLTNNIGDILGGGGNPIQNTQLPSMVSPDFWGGIGFNPPRPNWGQELKYISRGLLNPSRFGNWYDEPYVQQSITAFTNDINNRFGVNYTPQQIIDLANKMGGGLLGLHKAIPEIANQLMYSISPEEYHYSGQDLRNRGYGGLIDALTGTTDKYRTQAQTIEHLNRIDNLINKVKRSLRESNAGTRREKKEKGSLLGGSTKRNSANARHWG